MKLLIAFWCMVTAVASLRAETIETTPTTAVSGTLWAYADSRGRHFELRLDSDGSVVVRRLKTQYRRDPHNELGPGIRHYEIQNLKVGKWIQRDASVEFGIEDVDVTELPARTHPIETYQGSIASFRMAGEEKSTTWGSWRWTAEMIRGPNERGDGPAILLLADQPTFPSDSDYKSGEATVRMKVSPSGDVSEVRVVKATHKEFGNNAKEAAMQWKFVPRVKGGVAVEGIVEMTFVFHKTSSS